MPGCTMSGPISITALLEPISIVHIPLDEIQQHAVAWYRTVDFASTRSKEFFNITSNAIEVAIFACESFIQEEWQLSASPHNGLEISSVAWRVFEIDSSHLRDVSRPLAEAGISILYTSSHFTDFLFVKDSDYDRAVVILEEADCQVDVADGYEDSSDGSYQTPSAYQSSRTTDQPRLQTPPAAPLSAPIVISHTPEPPKAPRRISEPLIQIQPLVHSPSLAPCSTCGTPVHFLPFHGTPLAPAPVPEINVLNAPLACVGLNTLCESTWADRIRRFLVYPEEAKRVGQVVPSSPQTKQPPPSAGYSTANPNRRRPRSLILTQLTDQRPSTPPSKGPRPFISYTRTREGTSLTTEVAILRGLFPNDAGQREEMLQSGGELDFLDEESSESEAESASEGDDRPRRSESVPLLDARLVERQRSRSRGRTRGEQRIVHECPIRIIPIEWVGSPSRSSSGIDRRRSMGGIAAYRSWVESRDRQVAKREAMTGVKHCLQLDLRGFPDEEESDDATGGVYHLDSSGLVLRFSELMDSDNIRMLYASTYHTANILVEVRDVRRAKRLLERRRSASPEKTEV